MKITNEMLLHIERYLKEVGVEVDITGCARCGKDHKMTFRLFRGNCVVVEGRINEIIGDYAQFWESRFFYVLKMFYRRMWKNK